METTSHALPSRSALGAPSASPSPPTAAPPPLELTHTAPARSARARAPRPPWRPKALKPTGRASSPLKSQRIARAAARRRSWRRLWAPSQHRSSAAVRSRCESSWPPAGAQLKPSMRQVQGFKSMLGPILGAREPHSPSISPAKQRFLAAHLANSVQELLKERLHTSRRPDSGRGPVLDIYPFKGQINMGIPSLKDDFLTNNW